MLGYEPTVIQEKFGGVRPGGKSQVGFMVGRILGVQPNWAVDAGDALGCAICHLNMRRLRQLMV